MSPRFVKSGEYRGIEYDVYELMTSQFEAHVDCQFAPEPRYGWMCRNQLFLHSYACSANTEERLRMRLEQFIDELIKHNVNVLGEDWQSSNFRHTWDPN